MSKHATETCGQDLKKKRLNQKFRKEYSEKFPCIRPLMKGVYYYYARCMTCEWDFTISHGGMLDVNRNLDYKNKPNSTCTTQFFFFSNCRHIKRRRNAEKSNSGWSIGGQIFRRKSPSPTSPCFVDFGLVSPEHLVELLLLQKKVIEYYYSKFYSRQQYCTYTQW